MAAVTAETLLTAAYGDIGVLAEGEAMTAAQASDGLARLNAMLDGWAAMTKTQRFLKREVFAVVANQRDYTMGPGGDFNTTMPSDLEGAGLLLNASAPPVEIPRGLLTRNAWEAIQVKDLTSTQWTNVYFQETYASSRATVSLWPVPTTSLNSCVLYSLDTLAAFTALTTSYALPYGYQEALQYNVGLRLARPNGIPLASLADIAQMARESLAVLKRANYTIADLPTDPMLTHTKRGGYNINTSQGG